MKASDVNILDFISGRNKVFIIPPFQRNYEWNTQQCEELFNDLLQTYKNKKSHYLGNIVYYLGQNSGATFQEYILVDGQQRITTILLLLCALRDLTDNDEIRQNIIADFLTNRTQNEKYRIRLKQTAYDSDCFVGIINGQTSNEKNNTILNFEYFKTRIIESKVSIQDLYDTLAKFEIVDVNLQIDNDLSKVQTVFEKINSTGKQLEPADLIRNYLLLANTSTEQDLLYTDYWLKIEQTIQNDNISRFARDYLILNLFSDIPRDKIYKTFREHFDSTGTAHLDILKEMYHLSKYYEWFINETCPTKKLNHAIKYLNCLKTNDLYPLYLYLFNKLYDKDKSKLYKILNLLSDFMLRYRVVSPSGGGGALRSVIQNLLELLNNGEIPLEYDSILYELSNSANPSGRYPDNAEFKQALMEHIDIPYARVALLKLEEYETKNIPVPIDEVTTEHLMPQTLTDWWINNLGGELEADRIYEHYLNCIGNLAPISQGYNSKNSNKPWADKIKNLKSVQFAVTSEIASSYSDWTELQIKERNDDVSDRLCIAITAPLVRERKYQSKSKNGSFNGVYALSDLDISVTGTSIKYLIYDGTPIPVDTWRDLLLEVCKILNKSNQVLFKKIAKSHTIHKATSSRNPIGKDPIITFDREKVIDAREVDNTQIFVEGCLSAERARFYARQISEMFNLLDKFSIEVFSE
ncbi:MAG: DUF262 domain-containing protein [Clostridiales bacterium]|nr:DUF262 domain-containing protein [Clostridiales bacterium]